MTKNCAKQKRQIIIAKWPTSWADNGRWALYDGHWAYWLLGWSTTSDTHSFYAMFVSWWVCETERARERQRDRGREIRTLRGAGQVNCQQSTANRVKCGGHEARGTRQVANAKSRQWANREKHVRGIITKQLDEIII